MELTNEFRVEAPVASVWEALTDIERIAPCMPGAELQGVDGDDYRGVVRVKVGPITAQYKGVARFAERDDAAHRAVLQAEGRETRGQGNASATVVAQLTPDGDATAVSVVTDLRITGRLAQFGRGVLADVSTKLLGEFAGCLAHELLDGRAETDEPSVSSESSSTSESSAAPAAARREPPPPVDLLDAAGAPVAKRLIPIGVVVTAALWLLRVFRRRRRRRSED